MRLVAIDPSLNGTGLAWQDDSGTQGSRKVDVGKLRGAERLKDIRDALCAILMMVRPHVILIEGYAYGRTNQAHQLGELGGVLRVEIHEQEFPLVEVAPSALKKFATGKGNAPKDQVLAEAIRRLGYEGHSNDVADARWLLQMGINRYGLEGRIDLPKTHLSALEKVDFPDIEEV